MASFPALCDVILDYGEHLGLDSIQYLHRINNKRDLSKCLEIVVVSGLIFPLL